MKVVFAVIATLVLGPFVLGLIAALISNVTGRTRKKERAAALLLLARMPDDAPRQLRDIWSAFARRDFRTANRLAHTDRRFADAVAELLQTPRAAISSAGTIGDAASLEALRLTLCEQGYTRAAAAAITAVQHHHLEGVLEQLSDGDSLEMDTEAEVATQTEPQSGNPGLPPALEDLARDAPTMTRVLMDAVNTRLRRQYPNEASFDDRARFSEAGSIGGCVYLAICLHNEVPPAMRTPIERSMRRSLTEGIPDAEEWFAACSDYVREAVLEVPRQERKKALPVLVATWVVKSLRNDDDVEPEPMHAAMLAQVYANELSGYWRAGDRESDGRSV